MLHHGARAAAGNAGGAIPGQMVWAALSTTSVGAVDSYSWIVPDGVTEIHAVLVGAGQSGRTSDTTAHGGDAGDLRYTIDPIAVTPGETLTIEVGRAGSSTSTAYTGGGVSSIKRSSTTLIAAGNQDTGGSTAISSSIGGGNGGLGGQADTTNAGGGGGAGGYSGDGGYGQYGNGTFPVTPTGGAAYGGERSTGNAGTGGGVGLMGEGSSGTTSSGDGMQGSDGYWGNDYNSYGGGGGGRDAATGSTPYSGCGGVRIIWGTGRGFPDPIDAADYIPKTGFAYSEIEIRVTQNNSLSRNRTYYLNVYDENGVDIMPSLTPVAGSSASDFSSITSGEFTVNSGTSLTSAAIGTLNDGDPATYVDIFKPASSTGESYVSFFIKPSVAKEISEIVIGTYTSPIYGQIQYTEVIGDGINITNGRATPSRTYPSGYLTHTLTFT